MWRSGNYAEPRSLLVFIDAGSLNNTDTRNSPAKALGFLAKKAWASWQRGLLETWESFTAC